MVTERCSDILGVVRNYFNVQRCFRRQSWVNPRRCLTVQDCDPTFYCGKITERHGRLIVVMCSASTRNDDIMACGQER